MAKEGEKQGKNWQVVLIILGGGLAFIVLAFVVGIALFSGGSFPNAQGAQNQRYVDPTDTQVNEFMTQLNYSIDPSKFLQSNRASLDQMVIQLDQTMNLLEQKSILTGDSLTKAKAEVEAIKADISKLITMLETVTGAGSLDQVTNQAEVQAVRVDIGKHLSELDQIIATARGRAAGNAAEAISIALGIVDRNIDPNKPDVPYVELMNPMITRDQVVNGLVNGRSPVDAAVSMDCSGFVSYVLVSVGAISRHLNTEGLANSRSLTHINVDKNGNGTLEREDIITSLKDGTLLPGDVGVSNLSNLRKVKNATHAFLIISTNIDDPKSIVHSKTPTDTVNEKEPINGPKYTSWNVRIPKMLGDRYENEVVFLRPNYPKQ